MSPSHHIFFCYKWKIFKFSTYQNFIRIYFLVIRTEYLVLKILHSSKVKKAGNLYNNIQLEYSSFLKCDVV